MGRRSKQVNLFFSGYFARFFILSLPLLDKENTKLTRTANNNDNLLKKQQQQIKKRAHRPLVEP